MVKKWAATTPYIYLEQAPTSTIAANPVRPTAAAPMRRHDMAESPAMRAPARRHRLTGEIALEGGMTDQSDNTSAPKTAAAVLSELVARKAAAAVLGADVLSD